MDNFLCLCSMCKCRSLENFNGSVSSIFNNGQFYLKYCYLHHRDSPLEEIQLILNAASLFLILIHQNTKSTTGLNIYSILEERLKTD